jgi:excisionase family DNA binding protein
MSTKSQRALSWKQDTPQFPVQYLTIREAAKMLSIGESTLRRLINDGIMPSCRIGGSIRLELNQIHQAAQNGALELSA